MLTCGGNFEAVCLLLGEVWEQAASMVLGDLVVGIPAKDIVVFTGAEQREQLARMRTSVSSMLEKSTQPLTRHFLTRRGSEWVKYEGFAG